MRSGFSVLALNISILNSKFQAFKQSCILVPGFLILMHAIMNDGEWFPTV